MTAILRNTAQAIQTHHQQLAALLSAALAASSKELPEALGRHPAGSRR
jgi:hypothetical protein